MDFAGRIEGVFVPLQERNLEAGFAQLYARKLGECRSNISKPKFYETRLCFLITQFKN
jgi:hypothetical protein